MQDPSVEAIRQSIIDVSIIPIGLDRASAVQREPMQLICVMQVGTTSIRLKSGSTVRLVR